MMPTTVPPGLRLLFKNDKKKNNKHDLIEIDSSKQYQSYDEKRDRLRKRYEDKLHGIFNLTGDSFNHIAHGDLDDVVMTKIFKAKTNLEEGFIHTLYTDNYIYLFYTDLIEDVILFELRNPPEK